MPLLLGAVWSKVVLAIDLISDLVYSSEREEERFGEAEKLRHLRMVTDEAEQVTRLTKARHQRPTAARQRLERTGTMMG